MDHIITLVCFLTISKHKWKELFEVIQTSSTQCDPTNLKKLLFLADVGYLLSKQYRKISKKIPLWWKNKKTLVGWCKENCQKIIHHPDAAGQGDYAIAPKFFIRLFSGRDLQHFIPILSWTGADCARCFWTYSEDWNFLGEYLVF